MVNFLKNVFLVAALSGAAAAGATTITFEDLGVAPNSQLNPAPGVGVVTGGFNYTPGTNNSSGLNDLHIFGSNSAFGASNGTTTGGSHDDVVLSKVGGGAFSISAFDYAGFPFGSEPAFRVTGIRADASTISQSFSPDGLVDGPGGVVDFETFAFVGDWSNLVSVSWVLAGEGSQGLFALDNIVVDQVTQQVPEPGSLALLGLGLAGLAAIRRRKQA